MVHFTVNISYTEKKKKFYRDSRKTHSSGDMLWNRNNWHDFSSQSPNRGRPLQHHCRLFENRVSCSHSKACHHLSAFFRTFYREFFSVYFSYMKKNFKGNVQVIFDGDPTLSLKGERWRRCEAPTADVKFDESTVTYVCWDRKLFCPIPKIRNLSLPFQANIFETI